MAATTKYNGTYIILKTLYTNPLTQNDLQERIQEIDVNEGLVSLVADGLLSDINKIPNSYPIYKLTSKGRRIVEETTAKEYGNREQATECT